MALISWMASQTTALLHSSGTTWKLAASGPSYYHAKDHHQWTLTSRLRTVAYHEKVVRAGALWSARIDTQPRLPFFGVLRPDLSKTDLGCKEGPNGIALCSGP